MQFKIVGYLVLAMMFGCGQTRDLGRAGYRGLPPQKIGEVRGQSSLGLTVLSLYSGSADPALILGRVGVLDEGIEAVEVEGVSSGAPALQTSWNDLIREAPVYLLPSSTEKIELAAFVDEGFQDHLKRPLFYSRELLISPAIRYCSLFEFRGNSFLNSPVVCNGNNFCFIPQPSSFECRLDSEGRTECQAWQRISGLGTHSSLPYSRSNFEITQKESNAFVCREWKLGNPFSYRLRETKKLVRLRARFDRGIKIKIEITGNPIDSGLAEPKWVHFEEESMDFSWDK